MFDDEYSSPVLSSLDKEMRCGIFTNSHGQIVIIHDQEIQSEIQWVEFDQSNKQLSLIHESGITQPLGITLTPDMEFNLSNGMEITILHIENKKIISSNTIVFLISA